MSQVSLTKPIWNPVDINSLMPTNYSRKVQKPFQPTIIDPLRIPECVRNGHFVDCFYDSTDKLHWFISTNADVPYPGHCRNTEIETPCCFRKAQVYPVDIPWELIGQKKAMLNDDWVVLVDQSFEGDTLNITQCQVINCLHLIIV